MVKLEIKNVRECTITVEKFQLLHISQSPSTSSPLVALNFPK